MENSKNEEDSKENSHNISSFLMEERQNFQMKLQKDFTKLMHYHEYIGNECKKMQMKLEEISNFMSEACDIYPPSPLTQRKLSQLMRGLNPSKEKLLKKSQTHIHHLHSLIFAAETYSTRIYYCISRTNTRGYSQIYYKDVENKKEVQISMGKNFASSCLSCKISDSEIFLYIGPRGTKSCILNPKEFDGENARFTSVSSSVDNHYKAAFVLYRNKIYFFGGESRSCEEFDLRNKKWSEFSMLPELLDDPSACVIGEKAFIVARNSVNILEFDFANLSFQCILCKGLTNEKSKICMALDGVLVVVQETEMFAFHKESLKFNFVADVKRKKKKNRERAISLPIIIEKKFYFLNENKEILKFDLTCLP